MQRDLFRVPRPPLLARRSVEHQDLRELMAFPVRAFVRDGQAFPIRRDGSHGDAHDLAVSLLFRPDGSLVDPHSVQAVVAGLVGNLVAN